MITTAELHRVADRAGLRFDQAEKDYIILWLLSGLAHSGVTEHGWIFKGGTCLRHCYYEGYRFSEDIDFSCRPDNGELESSLRLLDAVVALVLRESGIRLSVGKPLTAPGDFQIEIPVEYTRGGARRQGLPQVKVHLTFDEPVLDEPIVRSVAPAYSDLSTFKITTYSKREIIAEKLRSLLQQQKKWPRPRDLYDLWYILCKSEERFLWKELRPLFDEKCRVRGVLPDIDSLTSDTLREWNENAWLNRLGPMLQDVPDFDRVWKVWVKTFQDLIKDAK
ncbi:MAG: nucleotidyl transferase AbiEii/AbiGii toxin family protein [Desulfuromonadales bacterium]|nr:nucleotidyl transferase AbiEii/AbiGii toxin family protein [Desulfuromonadales bacterium]